MSFSTWSQEEALHILSGTCTQPGPVLISLQAIQSEFGCIPAPALSLVAQACNVSRAEVHGVLTFYSDLRTSPPPTPHIRLCVAEACQAVGSRELVSELRKQKIEFDEAFCFGNCALGPSATVNGQLIGRANAISIANAIHR
jgi:formate dehydrogenase subunit gamma